MTTTPVTATVTSARLPAGVLLSVRGLTKTYKTGPIDVHAVRGVDLDVHEAEVLLVMGPSGSGKTTLLLMLGALLRPTGGTVTVSTRDRGPVDVAAAPERTLPGLRARTFGFVFQDYALLGALTATENIAVACDLAGVAGADGRRRARDLLHRVGLADRGGFRPSRLSGGEQQRVSVARALANDPPVLLADEPTANLDAAHGRDLARLLRQLADEDGRAIVIVSHDARLREVADRVLWLEDGAFRELASLTVDPVCGMSVERTGPRLEHQGKTLWFCSNGCRDEFLTDPGRFIPG
ncbi:MAG TPA: ATP-binding cassette domain-containing protein [Actinomycetes bacterium]